MITFLCFLLITLIFLNSPFLQKLLGAIIWILILAYLFGAAGSYAAAGAGAGASNQARPGRRARATRQHEDRSAPANARRAAVS
jgi:hypothetical protein